MSEDQALETGLVVHFEGGFYTVAAPAGRLFCTLAKRLRRGERLATNPLAIGDRVRTRATVANQGVIEATEPRRNELVRAAPGRDEIKHVLVANLDHMVIVVSLCEPPLNLAQLDRFLVIAAQAGVTATIVANKTDLVEPDVVTDLFAPYVAAGYTLARTSALTGEGITSLRMALEGRLSALIGPSGAGKSSLINKVQPGLLLRSAEVIQRTGKGRHTTTVATLLPLGGGGYVADTPGLRGIEPYDLDLDLLPSYFPEFHPHIGLCRFSSCTHIHEPGCAVRAALATGAVASGRYASFTKLYEEACLASRKRGRKRRTAGVY